MQETRVQSPGWEEPLEEEMAPHCSTLAWRIPMDRGAWWATVHGIGKSQTRLSDFTSLSRLYHTQEKFPGVLPGVDAPLDNKKETYPPKAFQHSSHLVSPPCVASVLQAGGAPTESLPHPLHAQGFSPMPIV